MTGYGHPSPSGDGYALSSEVRAYGAFSDPLKDGLDGAGSGHKPLALNVEAARRVVGPIEMSASAAAETTLDAAYLSK